jgi:hypothetical protein
MPQIPTQRFNRAGKSQNSIFNDEKREISMGEIRMTGEIRTDYDCEVTALPADRWAEAVFKIRKNCVFFRYWIRG